MFKKISGSCALVSCCVLVSGCGSTSERGEGKEAVDVARPVSVVQSALPVPPTALTLSFTVPQNIPAAEIAISGSSSLTTGNRATVVKPDNSFAAVAGLGSVGVHFGTNTGVGQTWSGGPSNLDANATINGDLHSVGAWGLQLGASVTGQKLRGPVPTTTIRRTVTFPSSNLGNANLEPSQERTLPPGAYQDSSIKRDATLRLSSGTYYFNSLTTEPNAKLVIDKSNGPVNIYVRTTLLHKGTMVDAGGAKANLLLGYFGTAAVVLESTFVGTLIAPSATITLAATPQPHVGAIFANAVEVRADAHLQFVPLPTLLITDVTTDKTSLCANDSVLVHVEADAAGSSAPLGVGINGNPGNDQYVQLTGKPGPRHISVTAQVLGGYTSTRDVIVQVNDCSTAPVLPVVRVNANRFHENTVNFKIANESLLGAGSTFIWDFGDGSPTTPGDSFISHDYSSKLSRDTEYSIFHASVRVVRAGQADRVVKRSVTVFNMYGFNKRRGTLMPPVSYDPKLAKDAGGLNLTGSYTIQNLEDVPVHFGSQKLELQPCNDTAEPTQGATTTVSIDVPARSSLTVPFSMPASTLSGVCRVGVHASGSSTTTSKASLSVYFDVAAAAPRTTVTNPNALALIKQIISQHLVPNPDLITEEQIDNLVQSGKISAMPSLDTAFFAPPTPPLGDECTPGDAAPRPGVSCQAASDLNDNPEVRVQGATIANALKGDAVLSHACGIVGTLLKSVNPPQVFSHSGLMIRYNSTIRHSTAAEERIINSPHDPGITGDATDGFEENVLKFGWPGTITETVQHAFNGEKMVDPDGRSWDVSSFNANAVKCEGDTGLAHPRILKADPAAGTAARTPLVAAATFAETMAKQGHYRFFAYSQMAQTGASSAPASAGWAQGTNGTMCSGYIWTAFKGAGITLEGGTVETRDFGAVLKSDTPDGLYFYSAANREGAAGVLYDSIYNQAYDKAGWLGTLFTDAPDDAANQIVNCFATDNCAPSAKDDASWRETSNVGDGVSVSPDNLMFWDVYPTNEDMIYRQSDIQRVYRWAPSADAGNLNGTVKFADGTVAPGANVVFAGLDAVTDLAGTFSFQAVPSGAYEATASKLLADGLWSGHKNVTISPAATSLTNIFLLPPPDHFRRVNITGNFHIVDDETIGSEQGDLPIADSVDMDLANPTADRFYSKCVGGEVRLEVKLHIDLQTDFSLVSSLHTELFEGTSCSTNDSEDSKDETQPVAKDGQHTFTASLLNSGFGGGDKADGDLTVTNAVKP